MTSSVVSSPAVTRSRRRTEEIVERGLDGELVVYDLERQQVHILNPTAAAVWYLWDGDHTPATIASTLAEYFPESRDVIQEDVENILQSFALEGLLEAHTGGAPDSKG
jgi:hypothetical protein